MLGRGGMINHTSTAKTMPAHPHAMTTLRHPNACAASTRRRLSDHLTEHPHGRCDPDNQGQSTCRKPYRGNVNRTYKCKGRTETGHTAGKTDIAKAVRCPKKEAARGTNGCGTSQKEFCAKPVKESSDNELQRGVDPEIDRQCRNQISRVRHSLPRQDLPGLHSA